MIDISTNAITLLTIAAAVAAFVDTLAGGGGLITVPALLLAGLPPLNALATNKVQGSIGTLTASLLLMRKGFLKPAQLKAPQFYCALAAGLGTVLVQFVPAVWLSRIVPLVLLMMASQGRALGPFFLGRVWLFGVRPYSRPQRMQKPLIL